MPSKRFAIDFKLPCRVSAPSSRYRDRCNPCLPRCAPGLRLRSRPCHATAMRSCLRHRPPMQSKTVALAPLPSSVGCLRPLPSPSPVQDRSPRPQSKTVAFAIASDAFVRSRPASSAPCHVTLAAMRSCLRHRHRCSRARSRPWPCHATDVCIPCHRLLAPAMAMSCYRDAQLPSHGHRHRCSRSPRCPQTDKRPQTVRQKTF